jgi:AraC family transcriptional regulator, transcriptional activator of pobA
MKSGSQPTALTLLDPRQGHIAFQLQNFTLAAESVFSERSNYFNIRRIKTGSGTWDLDLATFSFSSPALLFAAPYQNILLRSQGPISGISIRFHAEFFCIETHHEAVGCNGVLFNNVYGAPMVHLMPDDQKAFDAIIEQMHTELGFGALATSEILVSYLRIFLIKATRLKMGQDAGATKELGARIPPILDRLRALIEQHYRSKHRPADYAKMVGMNPRALGKLSRTYFHKTLTDLIRERILKHAKWQLLHTLRPIKEVAYEVGFDDEFYFSRLFKRSTGCSPQFYREYETEIRGGKNLLSADKTEFMDRRIRVDSRRGRSL